MEGGECCVHLCVFLNVFVHIFPHYFELYCMAVLRSGSSQAWLQCVHC